MPEGNLSFCSFARDVADLPGKKTFLAHPRNSLCRPLAVYSPNVGLTCIASIEQHKECRIDVCAAASIGD